MKTEILKEVIISQKDRVVAVPEIVERAHYDELLQYFVSPHAVIVKGIRRCGKSTLLSYLLQQQVPDQYYYLNFEDERLLSFTVKDFNKLYEVFVEVYGERKIFYFDEIQNIPQWEMFVRRMQDSGYKFFLTGSNASLLSKEMGTKLTGRHVGVELLPFSFLEFLKFHHWKNVPDELYQAQNRGMLRKFYNEYLEFGGMPEYLHYQQISLLNQVYEDILFRDFISRYDIKDIKALRKLGLYLITNMARPFSYTKLKNILGFGSVNTIKNYINYLEDCYLVFTTTQFSYSLKEQIVANKKVYIIDNGLANAISFQFSKNRGQFLENLVFIELLRRKKQVYYYRTQNNLEVDFLVYHNNAIEMLIQVAFDISHEDTHKREVKALLKAMDETDLKTGLLLTDDVLDEIRVDDKVISIKPIYRWLLEVN